MWRTILSTFGLVIIAELGDKTQLATMLLAAQRHSPWGVFLGAAAALVLSSLIGVTAGSWLMQVVPQHYLRYGAGAMFMVMGLLVFMGKI